MKCPNCNHQYSASGGGQGESGAPGSYLVLSLVFLAAAAGVFLVGFGRLWALACLGIAGFVELQGVVAWIDCRRGHMRVCPKCGKANPIRLWSF